MNQFGIGQPVRRTEDWKFLAGGACYEPTWRLLGARTL
jgi:hypothetical protein